MKYILNIYYSKIDTIECSYNYPRSSNTFLKDFRSIYIIFQIIYIYIIIKKLIQNIFCYRIYFNKCDV